MQRHPLFFLGNVQFLLPSCIGQTHPMVFHSLHNKEHKHGQFRKETYFLESKTSDSTFPNFSNRCRWCQSSVFGGGCERVQSIGDQPVSLQTMPFQKLAHSAWQSHWIRSCDGCSVLHCEGIPKEVSQSTEIP